MPAFKLTKILFIENKYDSALLQRLKENKDGMAVDMLHLLGVENAREQIEHLKKVLKELADRVKQFPATDARVTCPLKFLVHLFFICTTKNPSRRVLISAFQGFPEDVQTAVVYPTIHCALIDMFQQPIRKQEKSDCLITFEESYDLRHNVDTLSALLENFIIGEDCVRNVCLEALSYLGMLQQLFYSLYRQQLSPVQRNETMHHCLETVKLANRICQRSIDTMETRLQEVQTSEFYIDIATSLMKTDIDILQTADFLIDGKTTSGMNICLMLKYSCGVDKLLQVFSKSIFNHIDWFSTSYDPPELPDWLIKLNLNQLMKSCLSSSSYLCLCYGILAMVSMETLLQPVAGKCLVLDVILPELIILSKSCTDVGSKLLVAKSVCFLTQRLRTHIVKSTVSDTHASVLSRLHGDSEDMQVILDFVWTTWEDSVDAVRFTVKDIFENIITVHLNISNSGLVQDDPFIHKLTVSILNDVSWSCKGKYGTLSILVGHLGSAKMLLVHDGIAEDVLQQLQEQTLSCYASDLYENLFKNHMTELNHGNRDDSNVRWFTCWVDPVINILCGTNKLQKKHTIEYVLPKLLKTGQETLYYIIQNLTVKLSGEPAVVEYNRLGIHEGDRVPFWYREQCMPSQSGHQLGALIMCLRRARAMGQLQDKPNNVGMGHAQSKAQLSTKKQNVSNVIQSNQTGSSEEAQGMKTGDGTCQTAGLEMWYGIVDVDLLRQALICKDEQIRLDAFALLCENQKTTETIRDMEIHLIQAFIPQNLNNQNPSFRQHFISHLKKFLSRMKESLQVLKRRATKDSNATLFLKTYKTFLVWLVRCLFESLYPGSVFARRTTCLHALSTLMTIYSTEGKQGKNKSNFDFTFYLEIRPCDIHALVHCLTDTFEDNKIEATKILISCSEYRQQTGVMNETLTRKLTEIALSLSQSTRPQDSTTAAYMLQVMAHQPSIINVLRHHVTMVMNNESEASEIKNEAIENQSLLQTEKEAIVCDKENITNAPDDQLGRQYLLLWILNKSLEAQTKVAKSNLIVAAANRPLYPTMQCMRYCLSNVDFRKIPSERLSPWCKLLAQFIKICFEISEVVSPVVHNCSPEGNVPVDSVSGANLSRLSESDNDKVSKSHETVMLMPEYLVVCCWRSIKEISLILGQLTGNHSDVEGLLTYQQILDIGSYFTTQLLDSKHRGAFELAYAGFVKVTEMLWRSSMPDLHSLPRKWLSEVMSDIKSGDPASRLCATRRSAGVPFYVQALVSTEPTSTGRACFKGTMQDLLALACDENIVTADTCDAKVHALNILRAMYKDSRLKDDVAPYVAGGLKVAVLGFQSPLWAVRNSATLLMTAMMVRIFGVKRSKDESSFSRKNCQTGRTFFHNYPSLYQFLLDQISMATEHIATQLHPGLYPVLMVLGRLFPSAMEGTDTSLNLASFIPYVIKCSASPVLKTRVMAAKALQPLVDKGHLTSVFCELLTLLPCKPGEVLRQNQIHGVLLQLKQMMKTAVVLTSSIQTRLGTTVCDMWINRVDGLLSRSNPCLLTRKESLEVTAEILNVFGNNIQIHRALIKILKEESWQGMSVGQYDKCTPALSEFQTTVCKLYVEVVIGMNSDTAVADFGEGAKTGLEIGEGDAKQFEEVNKSVQQINDNRHMFDIDIEIEEVIIGFLNSETYEVRKMILSKLREICLQNNNSWKTWLPAPRRWDSDCDKDLLEGSEVVRPGSSSKGVYCCLESSDKIYGTLLTMVDMESREECQVQLFRLLQQHPLSGKQGWLKNEIVVPDQRKTCILQILIKLLDKLQIQTLGETVTAAIIDYTSVLVYPLYSWIGPKRDLIEKPKWPSDNERSILDIIMKWIEAIRMYCESESSSEVHLACAYAIKVNWKNATNCMSELMPDAKIHSNCETEMYKSVLDLLQADDLDVKDAAADLADVYMERFKVQPHPYVATDLLLDNWVFERRGIDGSHIGQCLMDAMLEEGEEEQDQEERLFDRGEANTYWDQIDFVHTLDGILLQYSHISLQSSCDDCETKFKWRRFNARFISNDNSIIPIIHYFKHTSQSHFGLVQQQLLEIIRKAVNKFIKRSEDIESSLGGLALDEMFTNSAAYQRNIGSIFRTLIVVKYGLLLTNDSESQSRCRQLWETMSRCLDRETLPPLICNALETIALIDEEMKNVDVISCME